MHEKDRKTSERLQKEIDKLKTKITNTNPKSTNRHRTHIKHKKNIESPRCLTEANIKPATDIEINSKKSLEKKCEELTELVYYWKHKAKKIQKESDDKLARMKTKHETSVKLIEEEINKLRDEHNKILLATKNTYLAVM